MEITIHNTTKVVKLIDSTGNGIDARIWEGETESGIPIHCYIARIAVETENDQKQFVKELIEWRQPSQAVAAIDSRLII